MDPARWTGLWHRLGAQDDGAAAFSRLAGAYAEPSRAYHTAEHIAHCLTLLDDSRVLARHPDEVEAAIWFHDAIYAAARTDNEERSAELARVALGEASVPSATAQRVAALILETRHGTIPNDPDAALLCDIDLAILGSQPERFDLFERQIRQEYSMVPEPMFRRGRSEVLRGFLSRDAIYRTELFRLRYEIPARQNLTRALAMLSS